MSKANLDYLAQSDSDFDREGEDFLTTNDDDFERGSNISWDEEDPFGLMGNANALTSKYYDATPKPTVKKLQEGKKIVGAASTTGMAKAGAAAKAVGAKKQIKSRFDKKTLTP